MCLLLLYVTLNKDIYCVAKMAYAITLFEFNQHIEITSIS